MTIRPLFTEEHATQILDTEDRLRVMHFHNGNTPEEWIGPAGKIKYLTVAVVENKAGELVGTGEAVCCRRDTPTRQLGRAIAVGRALKDYWTRKNDANTHSS